MTETDIRRVPELECDVVMKGGITSGVIYPRALRELGATYRLRGVGGASAGAIGAAVGAAAEYGRQSGGFDRMDALPGQLGDGRLAALFQPQKRTKPLLRIMLAATGNQKPGQQQKGLRRNLALLVAVVVAFPVAGLLGLLPGVALVVVGVLAGGWTGLLLVLAGIIVALLGWSVAVGVRLYRKLTVDVPANLFGICRGLGTNAEHPGFTDWLSDRIDDVAGLPLEARPLRFGHLWAGSGGPPAVTTNPRQIDLQMVSTCLSQGRPYNLPWAARTFFYDPETWATLFPAHVIKALEDAPPAAAAPGEDLSHSQWEERVAAAHSPSLRRLPDPEHLPVIVATRLSLSFPLLISAIPLWTIDHRNDETAATVAAFRKAPKDGIPPPESGLVFVKLWFTDGGLCSNFPVHLFDAALTTRPTFAINLGPLAMGQLPDPEQRKNVEFATDNNFGILPAHNALPEKGAGAMIGFASAAVNTARNWQDSSHLDFPGFRDRISRVLQSRTEGGLNLFMDGPTIAGLAERGRTAAEMMVEQFTQDCYNAPTATGWDNHRWVRYRALMAVLPTWLASYAAGRKVLGIDAAVPPSYQFRTAAARDLAARLGEAMDAAAAVVATADPKAVEDLTDTPRPRGMIRRIPTS